MKLASVKIIDYLLGVNCSELISCKETKRLAMDKTPIQVNPFKYYLGQINRFLFSGGLSINTDNEQQLEFLNNFWKLSNFPALLENYLERTSVTGEILMLPRYENGEYKINFYECLEFGIKDDKLIILTTKKVGNDTFYYRFDVDSENYYHYPLFNVKTHTKPDWKVEKVEPHGYNENPWVIVKNKYCLKAARGKSDFDDAAISMCCQLLLQYGAASENFYFFGQPWFASPDPKDTLRRIKSRINVFQKLGPEDGGSVELLSRSGMPKEQSVYIKELANNLYRHLGISVQSDINGKTDLSYVALKLLNEDTISTAETKWISLVENGLEPLLELISRLGKLDKVWVGEPEKVELKRKKPYFNLSAKEQLDLLTISERLVEAGVDTIKAYKFGIFGHLDEAEIEELMPNGIGLE